MRRSVVRLSHETTRRRLAAALVAVLVLAAAVATVLRPSGDGAAVRDFARGYAVAVTDQQDPALPGRVEYAARRGPDGLADLYRDLRRSTDASRAALKRLRAPARYTTDLARLTALLEQQSAALERLITAITSQDRDALGGATRELARTAAQASAQRSRIQRRLAGAKTS